MRLALVLFFGIVAVSSVRAQTESAVKGIVVTADGKPLGGVMVYGGVWKRCCPYQQDKVVTNDKGEFRLEHPGSVIHLSKESLQPLAFVVSPKVSAVRIVMSPSNNDLVVPRCTSPPSGQKQIGWGKYGLHFAVPENGMEIRGGKPDVDYVRYAIKSTTGKSYLELWFGPMAISTEPDDKLFIESADFSQRNLTSIDGRVIGKDSRGHLQNGASWRQTASSGSGAVYGDASAEEVHLFDQIINSICTTPSANR
jgi:hypothetical protein